MKPAWRAALSTYRRLLYEGHYESKAYRSAVEAYMEVLPEIGVEEARSSVTRAISWASVEHNRWLYPRNEDGSAAGIPNPHQRYWLARHNP